MNQRQYFFINDRGIGCCFIRNFIKNSLNPPTIVSPDIPQTVFEVKKQHGSVRNSESSEQFDPRPTFDIIIYPMISWDGWIPFHGVVNNLPAR